MSGGPTCDRAQSRAVQAIAKLGTPVAGDDPAMKDTRYRAALVAFRRQLIETALRDHGGNRTRAAHALGIRRTYLLRLIRALQVDTTRPALSQPSIPEPR